MGFPLGPSLTIVFLAYREHNWLDRCPLQHDDNISVLSKSFDDFKQFQSCLNSRHVSMSFTIKTEQNKEMSFLDVNVIRKQGKFIANAYQKPTFSGVFMHYDSYLPNTNKISMIYALVNRSFQI